MPQGCRNSAAAFQLCMESVLRDLVWKTLVIYIDDVIIYSKDMSSHYQTLAKVFERLRAANLKLHGQKCQWAAKSMRYLSNIITESTIRADLQKTSALRDYPQPRNKKELRMFLGTCGVYRKFCRRYSDIVNPLYRLLKNGAKWDFSDECVKAFNRIREIITSDQVLALPDLNWPFRVSCDSSFTSAAAVLSQIGT